ncbi:hypothetical protein B5G16_11570 [Alistipes sp. An66]|nr:hypothetical protein B5G16_11570 [Alistipes sp. An66]
MRMKSFYLLALAAALAFTGCKKDDGGDPRPGNLTIEKTEYALDAVENRTATVAFTAAADWTLSVVYDDAESAADWLTVAPASGTAGEQTVELSAARNFRASDRTAYADLVCGEQSVRLTVTQTAASDATDFTAQFDPDFAKELQKQGIIADAENITSADMEKIAAMTELDVSGTYENPGTLTALQGIEYFESLTFLKCDSNQLTTLDVSANTALTFLKCNSNQLTSLDVSANTALTYLYCHSNQLTKLDVSANTALTYLSCSSNSLTKLDVRQHTELMNLSCSSNSLTSLDVSRNTALTDLWCESNQLTELNVSANTALTQLVCNANQLTELDVRQNTALTGLWCYDNQLTKLDVSANTALRWLSCENNPGDGVSTFPVKAWFDNDTKPDNLELDKEQWTYGGKTITIDFQKAE